jgi:hypothetical protein
VSSDLPRPGSPASTVIEPIGTRSGQSQSVGFSWISAAVREIVLLLWGDVAVRFVSPSLIAPV